MGDLPSQDDGSSDNIDSAANTPTQLLREKLTKFRFKQEEETPSLRRSPRTHVPNRFYKFEEEDSELPAVPSASKPARTVVGRKRSAASFLGADEHDVKHKETSSSSKRPKLVSRKSSKVKAEYAPPEKYAHLDNLSDHLGERPDMLDVMFCGINPGQKSATVGHHFTHHSNHFWRCLYLSELTERLLDPSEDGTLPEKYGLGLTNLVERPSAQAAELANNEFTEGVPALLRKIVAKRPRIVSFVGKGIWESFIRAAAGDVQPPKVEEAVTATTSINATVNGSADTKVTTTTVSKSKKKAKASTVPFEAFDLQPYKVVHNAPGAAPHETLFFVTVSTSARVTSHQLPQKAKLFALLKQRVEELKAGTYDTSHMAVIPVPPGLA